MKRILSFSMWIVAMIIMASCSSSSSATPGAALKGYVDDLKAGNYEKFVEGMALEEGLTEDQINEQKAMWVSLLKEKSSKEFEKRGGFESIEIISEEIAEDGNSAVVTFTQKFGDGSQKENKQTMVKRDGKWLMDMNK